MDRVLFAQRELPPLGPDVAQDALPYDTWVRAREIERITTVGGAAEQRRPLHVVMVIDGEPPAATLDSLQSLARQQSALWRLTVVLEEPWRTGLAAMLSVSGIVQPVRVETREPGTGFDVLLDVGLAAATREDVALMFPGDVWTQDAVRTLSAALQDGDIAYADEDCLSPVGTYVQPRLKPEFSPEFLLHVDVIGRPLALGAGVALRPTTAPGADAASRDHDIALRAVEVAKSVRHVPEVLCHRLIPPLAAPPTPAESRQHIAAALVRRGDHAAVAEGVVPGAIRLIRAPKPGTTASIIIPFRDEPRFLRACLDSLEQTKGRINCEYLLVDNGSTQPETMTLLDRLAEVPGVRILSDSGPFNWARLNNAAALDATGDVLVFLNNDIEALAPGWLEALCAQAERDEVGAAGARLLYPDGRVQHCGVVLGLGGAAGHVLKGLASDEPGYMAMAVTTRECSAVTGACLATRHAVFREHNGFDESLGVDLNDIDYCLRLRRSGLRVMFEAAAELVHHESPSRGTAGDPSDVVRFVDRWETTIRAGDPYLSPHITRLDSSCALRKPDEEQWWRRWHAGLREG